MMAFQGKEKIKDPTRDELSFEEKGPCLRELDDYEVCMIFEEGDHSYCRLELLKMEFCEWNLRVNEPVLLKNNIPLEAYDSKRLQRMQELTSLMASLKPNPFLKNY